MEEENIKGVTVVSNSEFIKKINEKEDTWRSLLEDIIDHLTESSNTHFTSDDLYELKEKAFKLRELLQERMGDDYYE